MFKEGKSVAAHPIRITYKEVPGQSTALQAGFSVSSRNFKKAVDRNRIKRLLRESYRKQKLVNFNKPANTNTGGEQENLAIDENSPAPVPLAIFIIYTGRELPTYNIVDDNMKLALKKLSEQLSRLKK